MKSILTLFTILAVAFYAQAVSFQWNSSAKIVFGDLTFSSSVSGTGYLLYLGSDGVFSFDADPVGTLDSISDRVVASVKTKTNGSANAKGNLNGPSYGTALNGGYNYGVVIVYTDADSKTWYNISSDIFTIDPSLADNALGVKAIYNFASTVNETGVEKLSAANIGQGWFTIAAPTPDVPEPPVPEPPVPEPATAGVALLGLAMLFKRRKA